MPHTRGGENRPGENPHAKRRRPLDPSKLVSVGLAAYVAILCALTADQVFGWGIVRPALDRMLLERIDAFANAPRAVAPDLADALRRDAVRASQESADPLLLDIHDAAWALSVGAFPTERTLGEIDRGVASSSGAAAELGGRLLGLIDSLPGEARRAAREFSEENIQYVIDYHEFAAPRLVAALRRGEPRTQAVAEYCLTRLAWRFFRQRPAFGRDAGAWGRWWRETEAELERRSRAPSAATSAAEGAAENEPVQHAAQSKAPPAGGTLRSTQSRSRGTAVLHHLMVALRNEPIGTGRTAGPARLGLGTTPRTASRIEVGGCGR